jgi:hypothetical protein
VTTDRPESVETVLSELRAFINDSVAAYATAVSGVRIQAQELATFDPPPPENPDPTYHLMTNDPNLPASSVLPTVE